MSPNDIESKIKECLQKLYERDSILFVRNNGKGLCERCIVFRFALYLQETFSGYFVDCDFNSALVNGQQVSGKPITQPDRRTSRNRLVDIIVHNRTLRQGNDFICFEIKKWNNYDKNASDKDKNNLKVLTREYGYRYGFYLIFGKTRQKTQWIIFQNGQPLNNEALVFHE
ncbi:MAG TPA: hypothetical protein VMW16_14065 [Sedimentisphaerales bacterium]|nr:hypothetical protein [Sedimentisphaerales bacterium]